MALFRILRGESSALLSQPLHDGYAYFTPDDGRFYIDVQLPEPPEDLDIVAISGQVNGQTVYRIEVEKSAINDAIDEAIMLNHQALMFTVGSNTITYDGSVEVGPVDLQADWETTNTNSSTYIKNKPTIINIGITVDDDARTMFITSPILNGDGVSY